VSLQSTDKGLPARTVAKKKHNVNNLELTHSKGNYRAE